MPRRMRRRCHVLTCRAHWRWSSGPRGRVSAGWTARDMRLAAGDSDVRQDRFAQRGGGGFYRVVCRSAGEGLAGGRFGPHGAVIQVLGGWRVAMN